MASMHDPIDVAGDHGKVLAVDNATVAFVATRGLQERMLALSMVPCLAACAVPGARAVFSFNVLISLASLMLRRKAAGMSDLRRAFRLCSWWACTSANLEWFAYHTWTRSPEAVNRRPFLFLMGTIFFSCYCVHGALVTNSSQRIVMSTLVMVHSAYAQSTVPAPHKLVGDLEAVAFTALCVLASLAPSYYERGSARAGWLAQESAKESASVAAELSRQVAALENVRRNELIQQKRKAKPKAQVAARASRAVREVFTPTIPEEISSIT